MDPDQQRLLIETPGTSSSSSAQNFGGQGKRRRRRSDDDERRTESCGWARTWNPDHQPCRSFPCSCCCPPSSADVRPLPCPSPCPSLLLLLLVLLLLPALGLASNASSRKADELIEVDWTLQQRHQRTTLTSSSSSFPSLRRHASSASSPAQVVPTKFVRLKDVLRFRCPSQTPLAIHLVSAESALMCRLPDEKRERDRALIGYCGPHTSDPRLIIRRYSPLPGKPTFQPGQSYYFISTSDGTSDGVQSASGGLCRSNSLRLRIVVLSSASSPASSASSTVVESSSRPADELTNLAELLYNANNANDGADPPSSPPSSVHHPPPLISSSLSSSSSSSSSASTQQQEFDGFPAILTLEERDGQRRQVLVHSLGELAAQIDSANRRSGGAGLELSVHHQQQQQDPSTDRNVDEMSRYELSGSSEEQQTQQSRRHNNEAGGRHKGPQQSNSNTQRPPKSVRSPEPLVEPQKLIYIIGYGEGQSSSNGTDRAAPVGMIRLILIIMTILIPFLLAI